MTPAESTARYVEMHTRIGSVAPRRRVPRAQPPALIESDYGATLAGLVSTWRTVIKQLVAEALPSTTRTDDLRRAKPALNRARQAVASSIRSTQHAAERTASRISNHSKQQIARQTEAALGVAVPTLDRELDPRIRNFINENMSLIQKLGNRTIDDVETILARGYSEGADESEIAAEIMSRLDISERHARFIARDQTQRLYAQVTQMRHQEIGVEMFRWITQMDGHVRASHAVKHDRIFPYEGSRAPSFLPGIEPGCRCYADPSFDEIRSLAGIGKGRKRVV